MPVKVEGMEKLFSEMDHLDMDIIKALRIAGMYSMGDILRTAKKRCPVDTGRLRASLHTEGEIMGSNVLIRTGTNVEYAPYVEFGHKIKTSRAFLTRHMSASDLSSISKYASAGSVHMGEVKGQLFLTTAWEMNQNRIPGNIAQSLREQIDKYIGKKHAAAVSGYLGGME